MGNRSLASASRSAPLRSATRTPPSYEGTGFSWMEVLGAAASAPFLADRRLVIVRGLLERLDGNDRSLGNEWTKMADGLSDVPATTELLFVENVRLRRGVGACARLDPRRKSGNSKSARCKSRFLDKRTIRRCRRCSRGVSRSTARVGLRRKLAVARPGDTEARALR